MNNKITHEEKQAYYSKRKSLESKLYVVIIIAMSSWLADIYLHLHLPESVMVFMPVIILAAVLGVTITKCPQCKRTGFKSGIRGQNTCSVCGFRFVEDKHT